jgi:hypothetical protein
LKGESEYRRGITGIPPRNTKILASVPHFNSSPSPSPGYMGGGEKFGEREGYGLGRGMADGEREKYTDKYRRQGKIGNKIEQGKIDRIDSRGE